MFKKLLDQRKRLVTIDSRDSSITLSPRLLREMGGEKAVGRRMLVFSIQDRATYGFSFLPDDASEAQAKAAPVIQYNEYTNTHGFESLTPTAAAILYRYDIEDEVAQLYVKRRQIASTTYYEIQPPRK
nr:MAG TPA: hypothetical protein [Caudoviricetes sp.]